MKKLMGNSAWELLGFIILLLLFSSCSNKYRPEAVGAHGHVLVVMDSSRWNSQTAKAIRSTFGAYIMTLPQPEPRYDLHFMTLHTTSDLKEAERHKNVIFAATLNEQTNVGKFMRSILSNQVKNLVRTGKNFAFPLRNKWYNNQWVLLLTANNDSTLAAKIRSDGNQLVNNLTLLELQRWRNYMYQADERTDIENKLWKQHGWKIRVEHDYQLGIDTTDFVTLDRHNIENDRWIWAWWKDNVYSVGNIDKEWIDARRDSLMKIYIRGSRDSSYVTTEYRKPREVISKTINVNGYYTILTKGTWRMTHDAMGGPFVNFTIYVPSQHRLYMIEFQEYAPKYTKRRFVRQFEAMGYTFKADSTFVPSKHKAASGGK